MQLRPVGYVGKPRVARDVSDRPSYAGKHRRCVRSVLPMKISFILSFLLLGSFLLWFLLSSMHAHKTMDDAHHVGAAGEGTTGR
jgi:hypothetical protein